MATTPISDLIVDKLIDRFSNQTTTFQKQTYADLWSSWQAENFGGTLADGWRVLTLGVFPTSDTLIAFYGGSGSFADRAQAYWTAYDPGVG